MHIIQHELPRPGEEPGVQRVHVAGPGLGVDGLDCWLLTLAPQSSLQGHTGLAVTGSTELLVAFGGQGKLLLAGAPQRFSAPCTLVLPPDTDYRVVSQGAEPLQLMSLKLLVNSS